MDHKIAYWKRIITLWQKQVLEYLPEFLLGILVFIVAVLIAKYAKKYSERFYQKTFKHQSSIAFIFSSAIYFFFLLSGLFLSLQIMGLEKVLTKILTGAGIIGVIAGFAFKDVASNIFASLLLKIQMPFTSGDWVELGDIYGLVSDIGWLTTIIKTVPGQKVFVPNQLVYNAAFKNYSADEKRRVIFSTGVSYGDDLLKVRQYALEEVKGVPHLLNNEAIDCIFTEIGGSSYNFQLRFWISFTNNDDYTEAMSEIIIRIKKRFEKENISVAYPVTTLDFGVKGGVNLYDQPVPVQSVAPMAPLQIIHTTKPETPEASVTPDVNEDA